jgi:hypothetical protein
MTVEIASPAGQVMIHRGIVETDGWTIGMHSGSASAGECAHASALTRNTILMGAMSTTPSHIDGRPGDHQGVQGE